MGIDAQMLVKTRTSPTPEAVRKLSVDLCEAFGADRFWVWEDFKNDDGSIGRHALEIVKKFSQDGPDIRAKKGETLIDVSLGTRYYGPDYERGDIGLIINVASWLEARIPDARIFYGGDSSGVCAEPFGPTERAVVWAYFCRVGHAPYQRGFSMFAEPGTVVRCGFCATDMLSTGGGRDRSFYLCRGCDKKIVQFRDGRTVIVPRGKDFFDMRDEVPA